MVHADDTGWRIGGRTAFLMGFDTDQATLYQIRERHRNKEVREIVPADYQGVLVADRGKSCDAQELDGVVQQKCLAHLLRNVTDVLENKRGPARRFAMKLKAWLREGLTLWQARGALHGEDYRKRSQQLHRQLTVHLCHRILPDVDNQKLLDGIGP